MSTAVVFLLLCEAGGRPGFFVEIVCSINFVFSRFKPPRWTIKMHFSHVQVLKGHALPWPFKRTNGWPWFLHRVHIGLAGLLSIANGYFSTVSVEKTVSNKIVSRWQTHKVQRCEDKVYNALKRFLVAQQTTNVSEISSKEQIFSERTILAPKLFTTGSPKKRKVLYSNIFESICKM